MKERKIYSFIICGGIYLLLYVLIGYVLNLLGFQYRQWVKSITLIIIGIAIFIIFLVSCNKHIQSSKKGMVNAGGVLVLVVVLVVIEGYMFVLGMFSCKPEHVIINGKKKNVAVVSSFLDVYVDYYPYKNIFIMGKKSSIY